MQRRSSSAIAAVLVAALGACTTGKLRLDRYYVLHDVPYRNLVLKVSKDGKFYLRNRVHNELSFGQEGEWRHLDNNHIVLYAQDTLAKRHGPVWPAVLSPPMGTAIEVNNAQRDKSFIFPKIKQDTVRVLNGSTIELLGYYFTYDQHP